MVKELNFSSFSDGIDIENDYFVIFRLKKMSGKVERHLRTCAVVSSKVESVYPNVAVTEIFKADIGIYTAYSIKITFEEVRLVRIYGHIFFPNKTGEVRERNSTSVISE